MRYKPIPFIVKALLVIAINNGFAQAPGEWVTNGPTGATANPNILTLSVDPNQTANIYAGTNGNGLYFTKDAGFSWQQANAPLNDKKVTKIHITDKHVYAVTEPSGFFISSNGGVTWFQVDGPFNSSTINAFVSAGNTSILGTNDNGIFSSNDGINWSASVLPSDGLDINSLISFKNRFFAGTKDFGVLSSADGVQWSAIGGQFSDLTVNVLFSANGRLFAGTRLAGIFWSENGDSWTQANSPMQDKIVINLLANEATLFAVTQYAIGISRVHTIFRSADGGNTWVEVNKLPESESNWIVPYLIAVDDTELVGWFHRPATTICFPWQVCGGLYYSMDAGDNWQPANYTTAAIVNSMIGSDEVIYAGTSKHGVLQSTNQGKDWFVTKNINNNQSLGGVVVELNLIAAYGSGVFVSLDGGESWVSSALSAAQSMIFNKDQTRLLAGSTDVIEPWGVRYSDNGGETWKDALGVPNEFENAIVADLFLMEDQVFAVLDGSVDNTGGQLVRTFEPRGLYRSKNGLNWTKTDLPDSEHVLTMRAVGNRLYAGIGHKGGFANFDPTGIYYSTVANGGLNWTPVNMEIESGITAIITFDGRIYAGTENGILRSTNGLQWDKVVGVVDDKHITALSNTSERLFAASREGVFFSFDGQNWQQANPPMNDQYVTSLLLVDSVLYAGTLERGVFRSLDGGLNWTPLATGMGDRLVRQLARLSQIDRLFAVTDNGVYQTLRRLLQIPSC